MKKMNCLIIDDEPLAREVIAEYVQQLDFLHQVGTARNALEANSLLLSKPVDLLFLDIQMPQLSGLEFLRQLPHKPLVILTTAFPEYALEGYELDVVDYLLKPISLSRFVLAVNKAAKRLNMAQSPQIPKASFGEPATKPFVYLKGTEKMVKLFLQEILYIESTGHYVKVMTVQGQQLIHESISVLAEKLPSELFLRIHRSFMVNLSNITAYSTSTIELGNYEVPIGRKYKDTVKKRLG